MSSHQYFPRLHYIIDISNEQYAVVTFSDAHDFVENEIVSFRVTKPYGMVEINERRATVLAVGDLTITINIDTTFFIEFIYPADTTNAPPVCVPVGSGVNYNTNFAYTILNDAFDNVRV